MSTLHSVYAYSNVLKKVNNQADSGGGRNKKKQSSGAASDAKLASHSLRVGTGQKAGAHQGQ